MPELMRGKRGLVMGVANDHSIAWGVARTLAADGAKLAFTYQGESLGKRVKPLAASVGALGRWLEDDPLRRARLNRGIRLLALRTILPRGAEIGAYIAAVVDNAEGTHSRMAGLPVYKGFRQALEATPADQLDGIVQADSALNSGEAMSMVT